MKAIKRFLNYIFVDGMAGMATGLFATLIIGTILSQIAGFVPGRYGVLLGYAAALIKALTGAGIGVGVAVKFKDSALVTLSAAGAGMIGAFAAKIIGGSILSESGAVLLAGPGEPLGAFIAVMVAVSVGRLVSGKTKLDILITPLVTITVGGAVGLLVGPPISAFMAKLGELVNWGTEQAPILMGIVVSVIMGMILTLPISSAALGVMLNLGGLAAGAATIGCSAQMVGFAVASFRENKWGGLFAQGVGTSMLQVPNIMRRPLIWIPPILASAILGPIGTALLGMTNNAVGSGMGTSGLVGQIMTYQTMTAAGQDGIYVLVLIILMHIVLPAALTLAISEGMRKAGWIKNGDMKLDL
ncbi:MAG: PTS sugar transporter subunit IIC [Clostridia bacterium]|nr:PTS sugar transporter subunit IIC [Clostridia bacterium]